MAPLTPTGPTLPDQTESSASAQAAPQNHQSTVSVRDILAIADYVHRNEHAKEWAVRGILIGLGLLGTSLPAFALQHVHWVETHMQLLIRLRHELSGSGVLATLIGGACFFLPRIRQAGVIDRKKTEIPEWIEIANSSTGNTWAIDKRTGRAFPVRSNGDYKDLPPTSLDTSI